VKKISFWQEGCIQTDSPIEINSSTIADYKQTITTIGKKKIAKNMDLIAGNPIYKTVH